ncbi:hypothetical protein ACTWPT_11980 [Nonomuraea sp. 3N208]|uniref:hypothetical protein n=1 Tax=Nonomuraea sp. 3N208 TaxID=3457421 RepID=UPI003FCD8E75
MTDVLYLIVRSQRWLTDVLCPIVRSLRSLTRRPEVPGEDGGPLDLPRRGEPATRGWAEGEGEEFADTTRPGRPKWWPPIKFRTSMVNAS